MREILLMNGAIRAPRLTPAPPLTGKDELCGATAKGARNAKASTPVWHTFELPATNPISMSA
jgi:hypothetical protein